MNNHPVGVMDSGVGGLTVASVLRRLYPEETIVYVGDSARNPYGERSPEDIAHFAEEMKAFLIGKGVKAVIVACNTITFNTPPSFYEGPVPIIGMSADFSALPKARKVAVFATPASIASHSHAKGIARALPEAEICEVPCDGLANAIETGASKPEIRALIARCIAAYHAEDADAAVLGCTHYPLERDLFEAILPHTAFLDPAERTVKDAAAALEKADALADRRGEDAFYFTAAVGGGARLVREVFGKPMPVYPAAL